MAYERLVGLQVTDPAVYQQYREAMYPLLKLYGGGFRYDFWIQDTLKSETNDPINRVFLIYFRDKESSDVFFSRPDYLEIRKKYFEASVSSTTILASYERA